MGEGLLGKAAKAGRDRPKNLKASLLASCWAMRRDQPGGELRRRSERVLGEVARATSREQRN
jgi:hypothetical protein